MCSTRSGAEHGVVTGKEMHLQGCCTFAVLHCGAEMEQDRAIRCWISSNFYSKTGPNCSC